MSKVKIECLTDVHIGSGDMLYLENDYCIGKDSEGYKVIGVIDPRKVLNFIGVENIGVWLAGIESKRPVMDIVQQFAPNATLEDFCSRVIDYQENSRETTLKSLITDGLGRPYIPGSSIKGAIRTAILATEASDRDLSKYVYDDRSRLNDSGVEHNFFGKDPNSDIFRFLQVGDAIFGDNMTSAETMVNINERTTNGYWDESRKQLIEVLCAGDMSYFELRLKSNLYNFCSRDKSSGIGSLPESLKSKKTLFNVINEHTKYLTESEIDHWKAREDKDNSGKVDQYIEMCESIKDAINKCNDSSCILRIGHASGWRFITGAWTEGSSYFDAVKNAARPQNARNYMGYDFPKSRRVSIDCGLLGFVKLSITNE